jgi:hypothetical protein
MILNDPENGLIEKGKKLRALIEFGRYSMAKWKWTIQVNNCKWVRENIPYLEGGSLDRIKLRGTNFKH